MSRFQALTTALASTIGTGNIVGVGTAVFLGGPGAALWCWLTGVFGIATKYAESLIAVKYRVQTKDGRMQGGAMYALERGLHMKWLGVVFAAFAMLASFGIGCGTQINAISEIIQGNSPIDIPPLAIGIVFAAITAVVIIGGIKSIAVVCERLVPLMAAFYVVGCVVILCINWDFILPALQAIFTLAFQPGAVAGGLHRRRHPPGDAVRRGARTVLQRIRHGLRAAGRLGRTDAQSGAAGAGFLNWHVLGHGGGVSDDRLGAGNDCDEKPGQYYNMDQFADGGQMTTAAFSQIPVLGPLILVVGIITFAYSTILGWSYYGERCCEYLFGAKGMLPYKLAFILVIVIGPVLSLDLAWTVANILNALMAVPNLIAVLLLSGVIARGAPGIT